jgi:coenzyme PQQ precursor peptide PqqA
LGGTVGLETTRTLSRFAVDRSEDRMKLTWHKPEVVEQEVGLEVTSYLPAELDRT